MPMAGDIVFKFRKNSKTSIQHNFSFDMSMLI